MHPRRPEPPPGSPFTRDLNVLISRTCNATCAHCSVDSSPRDRRSMDADTLAGVRRLIPRFAELPGAERVVLTGGEPLLRRDVVRDVAAAARGAGLRVGVETNAYWARTPEAAAAVVAEGLIDDYLISASIHHAEFIPAENVCHAYRAAAATGGRSIVRVTCRTPPLPAEEQLLAFLRGELPGGAIEVWPLAPTGRAATLDIGRPGRRSEAVPPGLCPADGMVIDQAGRVHPCCSSLSTLDRHSLLLGDVRADDPADVLDRLLTDPVFHFLRTRGLAELVERVRAEAPSLASEGLTFPNDLCHSCALFLSADGSREWVEQLSRSQTFRDRAGVGPRAGTSSPPA